MSVSYKHADLLNRLSEMQQSPYHAMACQTLVQAEMAIVALENELRAINEKGDERRHFICVCPDCVKPIQVATVPSEPFVYAVQDAADAKERGTGTCSFQRDNPADYFMGTGGRQWTALYTADQLADAAQEFHERMLSIAHQKADKP